MKPTVIPSGNNNENNTQGINPMNVPIRNSQQDSNNNPAATGQNIPSNTRGQFPQFQQGFGFDPDIDDIFSDTGIRSRLPTRMRDPFSTFGTHDDDDFFPAFGNLSGSGRRARANPQTNDDGFFTNFPDEFRQYIPEGFGFPSQRRSTANTASGSPQSSRGYMPMPQYQQQPQHQQAPQQHQQSSQPYPQQQQQSPQQQWSYQQVPQQHPQYQQQMPQYQHYPQGQPQYQAGNNCSYEPGTPPVPQSPKPQLCDASIQTEDLSAESADVFPSGNGLKLRQHGLRNTMDMGQKSAQEEQNRGPRSHSAPPHNQENQFPQGENPIDQPTYVSSATFKTSIPKKMPPQMRSQGSQQNNYNSSPPLPPLKKQSAHIQRDQPPVPTTPGGSYIRTVPMFVEGRKEPVINSHKVIPNQHEHEQQQQKPPPPQSNRPTVNTQQANQSDEVISNQPIPQTPHTTDCINKITEIQRDVLELMTKVENFAGKKNDKDYMYLDEMLTRNLLKLDTIDTNGKESIRLARKEAIKCIQASINVLEAKSGENARYVDVIEQAPKEILPAETQDMTVANYNQTSTVLPDENLNILDEQTVIPLPPPPAPKSNITNDIEENPNILDDHTVIALPAPPTNQAKSKNDSPNIDAKLKIEETSNSAVARVRSASKSPVKDGAKKKIVKKIKKITKDSKGEADEHGAAGGNSEQEE